MRTDSAAEQDLDIDLTQLHQYKEQALEQPDQVLEEEQSEPEQELEGNEQVLRNWTPPHLMRAPPTARPHHHSALLTAISLLAAV